MRYAAWLAGVVVSMAHNLGTKEALLYALNEICPNTRIEEWFEYGGDPYYFRVILNVGRSDVPMDTVMRLIDTIRPVRSVLEKIDVQTQTIIEIEERGGAATFYARMCGTPLGSL